MPGAQTTEESLGKHETSASGATLEENTLADFDGNNELETSDLSQRAKSEVQPVRNIKDDAS